MPGRKEDLLNAQTSDNPDLNFSYNELLEELKQEHGLDRFQEGDVTLDEVSKATGHTKNYCSKMLKEKVNAGTLKQVKVRWKDGKIKTVYRKSR